MAVQLQHGGDAGTGQGIGMKENWFLSLTAHAGMVPGLGRDLNSQILVAVWVMMSRAAHV